MKPVSLGLLLAAAAWGLWPQAAAAQCEGGTSTAGYYLRNGSYMPGGCAYTNATTPGQMHPSGAQPLPSTNPVAGASALPGQQVATGPLPVTAGDLGQPFAAVGASPQTLGPGAPNDWTPGGYLSTGLGVAGLGTTGHINGVTGTQGLPPTTSTSVLSSGTTNLVLPGVQAGAGTWTWDAATGRWLRAGSLVSSQAVSPMTPNPGPPVPGRGGPTYIGEEGPDDTIISLPNQ
jgi:hypothetical protein